MSSYKDLLAQRAALDVELDKAFKEERAKALEDIIQKMEFHQITVEDIRSWASKGSERKVAAKYRHPVTGQEWSGRGKAPSWIKDAPDRARFLVKSNVTTGD